MPDTRTFRVVDEDGDYEEFTGNPLDALNAAYRERAHLVALLAAVYPSRWGYDPNATQWRIVYVDLPTGQASWHISPDDVALFPHVTGDGGDQEWDGHTTAAKYERIDQLTALLAQAAEPDEEQLGQMAVPRFEIEHQAQAERDADVRAVPAGHGPGVPGAMHLDAFGQSIADAFGECPYHVGSSATSKTWRDVDVRLILPDDEFDALFPGWGVAHHIDALWSLLCAALSELGRVRTGLPIDFQIQRQTEANEKYPTGIRNPLMLIRADDQHRPTRTESIDALRKREQEGGAG